MIPSDFQNIHEVGGCLLLDSKTDHFLTDDAKQIYSLSREFTEPETLRIYINITDLGIYFKVGKVVNVDGSQGKLLHPSFHKGR